MATGPNSAATNNAEATPPRHPKSVAASRIETYPRWLKGDGVPASRTTTKAPTAASTTAAAPIIASSRLSRGLTAMETPIDGSGCAIIGCCGATAQRKPRPGP